MREPLCDQVVWSFKRWLIRCGTGMRVRDAAAWQDIDEPWSGSSSSSSGSPGCKPNRPVSSHGCVPTGTQLGASWWPTARGAVCLANSAGAVSRNNCPPGSRASRVVVQPPTARVPEQVGVVEGDPKLLDTNPAVLFVFPAPGETILGLGNAVVNLLPGRCALPQS